MVAAAANKLIRTRMLSLLICAFLFMTNLPQTEAGKTSVEVPQWAVFETQFTSKSKYANPLSDVDVVVTFRSPAAGERVAHAFWDGGNTWRVRFSPEEIGEWSYSTSSTPGDDAGLDNVGGTFRCVANKSQEGLYQHGSVRVSSNRRYLTQADGTPFFWLSDTVWNGPLKADGKSWETYVEDRKSKGFTVLQFVMTQWVAAGANAEGRLAYEDGQDITIDPTFYQRMDARIRTVNEKGLVAAPVLIWDGPVGKLPMTLNPGLALNEDRITKLVRYMVVRYEAYQVIWILAGDGDYRDEKAERWKRIARAGFGEHPSRVATMHPAGEQWVEEEFEGEPWFSFVGYQSGHGDSVSDFRWLSEGPPAKGWRGPNPHPIINLEPNYEGHMSYQGRKPFDAHAVRRAAYWSLLISPTAGVTYGAHGVWSWETVPAEPMNHAGTGIAHPWTEAMHLPGSMEMKYLKEFFGSFDWWKLSPAKEVLAVQPGDADAAVFVAAARSSEKDWAVLYVPVGQTVQLRKGELPAHAVVRWFNPSTGQWAGAATAIPESGELAAPDGNDWAAWIGKDSSR